MEVIRFRTSCSVIVSRFFLVKQLLLTFMLSINIHSQYYIIGSPLHQMHLCNKNKKYQYHSMDEKGKDNNVETQMRTKTQTQTSLPQQQIVNGHMRFRSAISGTQESLQYFEAATNKSIEHGNAKSKPKKMKNKGKSTFKNIKINHINNLKLLDHEQESRKRKMLAKNEQTESERKGYSMGNLHESMNNANIINIEEMLREEKYRKKMNELKTQLSFKSINNFNPSVGEQEYENMVRRNTELRNEVEQLKNQLVRKECEWKKQISQNYTLNQQLLTEKQHYLSLQIQTDKIKYEYQQLKDKYQKNNRKTNKSTNIPSDVNSRNNDNDNKFSQEVKRLNQALQLKDMRYSLLLKELQTIKYNNQINNQTHQYIDIFKGAQIKGNIQIIKSRIQEIKLSSSSSNHNQHNHNGNNQNKMALLQQIIHEQSEEKLKLIQEVHDLINKYETKCRENQQMKNQLSKNARLLQLCNSKLDDSKNLNKVIGDLETKYIHKTQMKQQQHSYQVQKVHATYEFKMQNLDKQYNANLQIYSKQVQYWKQENEYWRKQTQQVKDQLLIKTKEHYEHINRIRQEYQQKLKQKFKNSNPNNSRQQQMAQMERKHQEQMKILLNRLEQLSKSNERYCKEYQRYVFMENENKVLKDKRTQVKSTNVAIDHLWSIKEIQYNNLNHILSQLK